MIQESDFHPNSLQLQRTVATACIVFLSIIYLAGYVQWHKIVGSLRQNPAAVQLEPLAPPTAVPGPLVFAPDVAPPPVNDGVAPVISNVPTTLPVVFLTIDDGVYHEPEAAARMRQAWVPASLFLTQRYTSADPGYFGYITEQTGSVIENHTLTHPYLPGLSYAAQHNEICRTADIYQQVYGVRPALFRPPYGSYNLDTQRAVASCGMKAVVLWKALVQDGAMQYQTTHALHPGDIVLMHFTPSFRQDLQAFLDASKAAGLTPQLLEDWLRD